MPIDPEIQLHINEEIAKHKIEANASYAIKLVEKIVFYMVGAASIGVLGALIKLVLIS
jgi:hypothetical protein